MVLGILAYQLIFHITTIITVLLQSYVIYAIKNKTPTIVKGYRVYLIYFSFLDLCFTIIYGLFFVPDPVGRLLSSRPRGLSVYISPQAQILSVKI
jgi:hypothetical protein